MHSYGYLQIIGGPRSKDFADPAMAALQSCGEADTYNCGHCQRMVILTPDKQADGMCRKCWRLVCKHCVEDRQCRPLEEEIERKIAPRGW